MAARGRPTQFQIAPHAGKSWRAVVELGEDNRLPVPVDASRRAPWLERDKAVLAVLEDDVSVTLRPYAPFGERVEAKLEELEKIGAERSESTMLAIRAKYLRLKVYDDGRMIVPNDVRACLALAPARACFLSLTIIGDKATLKESGPREISEAASLLETIDLD